MCCFTAESGGFCFAMAAVLSFVFASQRKTHQRCTACLAFPPPARNGLLLPLQEFEDCSSVAGKGGLEGGSCSLSGPLFAAEASSWSRIFPTLPRLPLLLLLLLLLLIEEKGDPNLR